MTTTGAWDRIYRATPYDDLRILVASARERHDDAWRLFGELSRGLACVYLAGYAVEISMKSAILKLAGVTDGADAYGQLQTIEGKTAVTLVRHHNLVKLADNLLNRRAASSPVVDASFEGQIRAKAALAAAEWSEQLRYRAGSVSEADTIRMIEIATWFVQNSRRMAT